MKVVLFMRRPRPAQSFSVELLIESLVKNLSTEFEATRAVSSFHSNGLFRRVYNVLEAALRQGQINHVTGDVHFLTYLLPPKRTVLTVLDCGRISAPMDLRKRLIRLLWFTLPVRQVALVTVISQAVKDELLTHVRVDPGKIRVVYVAVSEQYHAIPKPFDVENPVILQIGTAPNKNIPRLIEALAGVKCRLRIIGQLTQEHRALLQRHAIQYENFVGLSNEQILEQYAGCDVVSFASTLEGFGMPIVEANLVGRPVVTSNVASMPEVAGDAACLVDPFSTASIRAGFLKVLTDEEYRRGLVERGFLNAARFDAGSIARQYEAVYRELAGAMPQRST